MTGIFNKRNPVPADPTVPVTGLGGGGGGGLLGAGGGLDFGGNFCPQTTIADKLKIKKNNKERIYCQAPFFATIKVHKEAGNEKKCSVAFKIKVT